MVIASYHSSGKVADISLEDTVPGDSGQSHEVSGVCKSTETGSRQGCQGLGKGGAGGRGVGKEKEQERGKEKGKKEKMRNGLDEELGSFRMGGGRTGPRVA